MRSLPRLEYLNGLPVDREGLLDDSQQDMPVHQVSAAQSRPYRGEQVQEVDEEDESEEKVDNRATSKLNHSLLSL